jgi:glyoxylase-like metal-dependent hydrolase (beta-lactamase superfamily II)/SAM-dependent methyltransferase
MMSGSARVPAAARLISANDRVYCATKYALGNVLYVLTGQSVVVIDTTGKTSAARASLEDFRKQCSLPVSCIIYTHFHSDHIGGARVFRGPSTQVIAQRMLPEELASKSRVRAYRDHVTALQFGFELRPPLQAAHDITALDEPEGGYVPPDTLFDEAYEFREGDLRFELFHAQGESLDHVMTWVPRIRTLFPGDLYYNDFPMLSNPMKPSRPVLAWAESLDRMRALRPSHLVPSHGPPLSGADKIDVVLANYARAIRHVHDETVKRIDQGLPLEEILRQVKLPGDLARLPYLQERYGTVAWSVTGIFRQYTGWYDLDPANLGPSPRAVLNRALLDSCGGPAPLLERARRALRERQPQLALELAEIVLAARPGNHPAQRVRLQAMRRLASTASENRVARRIYRTAARRAAARLGEPLASSPSPPRQNYTGVWVRGADEAPALHRGAEAPAVPAGDQRIYGGIGLFNMGFWTPDTRSMSDACDALLEVLLAFIPRKTGTILDLACGSGSTARHLTNHYPAHELTGISTSRRQLRSCRREAPGGTFLPMAATDLGFANATFDNVICVEAAHRFGSRRRLLEEASRVLKPAGRLVLAEALPAGPRRASSSVVRGGQWIDPTDYRELYLGAGFERVEILDATHECVVGLKTYGLRLLRDAWRGEEIDLATYRRRSARLLQAAGGVGHYLLVCAQKALAT